MAKKVFKTDVALSANRIIADTINDEEAAGS
jgi:hypothetical protein